MKIRSLLNGQVSSVRGDIAREMVKLGVAEIVPDGTVARPGDDEYRLPKTGDAGQIAPKWSVVVVTPELSGGQPYAAIQLELPSRAPSRWFGSPKNANLKRSWPGGSRFLNGLGREIPEAIIAEYANVLRKNKRLAHPFVPPSEIAFADPERMQYQRQMKDNEEKKEILDAANKNLTNCIKGAGPDVVSQIHDAGVGDADESEVLGDGTKQ